MKEWMLLYIIYRTSQPRLPGILFVQRWCTRYTCVVWIMNWNTTWIFIIYSYKVFLKCFRRCKSKIRTTLLEKSVCPLIPSSDMGKRTLLESPRLFRNHAARGPEIYRVFSLAVMHYLGFWNQILCNLMGGRHLLASETHWMHFKCF